MPIEGWDPSLPAKQMFARDPSLAHETVKALRILVGCFGRKKAVLGCDAVVRQHPCSFGADGVRASHPVLFQDRRIGVP